MCATCGCSAQGEARIGSVDHDHAREHAPAHAHDPAHPHRHDHAHPPGDGAGRDGKLVRLEQDVLAKNDRLAQRNRGWLEAKGVVAINLMSAPGAGKTTLLERTIRDLDGDLPISVIEGDQETALDAERIRATGCRVLQINTGSGCHLDADMVAKAMKALDPPPRSLVVIENVGNLVCPALFDLGEQARVVVASVAEGDDKPLKYPHVFRASDAMVLNKIDLLPHVRFDVERCAGAARRANPRLEVIPVSATRGVGLGRWYAWLRGRMAASA
jgi:hydrogenase nickel incorporation protein HypB